MKHLHGLVCRLLIASMLLLPFSANAGMIGTREAAMGAQEHASRDTVREFMARDAVATELLKMGISPATARERVDAMTQEEVDTLAGKIDDLPAGGVINAIWITLVAIVMLTAILFILLDKSTK